MIRAIIVENEPPVAEQLNKLLNRNFADIEVLGIYETVTESLEAIKRWQPHLVFLDVELHSGETGFEILRKLSSINFKVIFTTAHNQYAIQAIKFSALDFLIKPIDEDELREAVMKFSANRSITTPGQHDAIVSYEPGNQHNKIGLPDMEGIHFVQVSDILYCEGESAQTSFHFVKSNKQIISRTLKECVEILEPFDFCRIHKSYFINLRHVDKYHKGDGGYVIMANGKHLDVSKTYKDDLLSRLRKL